MPNTFESRFTGGAFIAAALMLWLGWLLLPVKPGTFFQPEDFARIHGQFHLWIWMYRVHLFGMITAVMAYFALASLATDASGRVLLAPGAAVASAGMLVGALGEAFYYHHGAWGSLQPAGQPAAAAQAFVDALRVQTEYITCLIRFGRVFGGLGLLVLAWGLQRTRLMPAWSAALAALLGVAAMALTMALPDELPLYLPIFHALSGWMLASGLALVRGGAPAGAGRGHGPA